MARKRIFVCFPAKVRFHYLRIAIVVVCAIMIFSLVFFKFQTKFERSRRVKYVKNIGNNTLACRLPTVDPFHPSILKFIKDFGKLRCGGRDFSSFENGVLRIKGEGITSAKFRTIERPIGEDFEAELSRPVDVLNRASNKREQRDSKGLVSRIWDFLRWNVFGSKAFFGMTSVEAEFIRVDVVGSWGFTETDLHMRVVPKKEAVERKLHPGGIPLDVALVMFDSTSAANFRRKLPNTLEYLTKNLKSVFLRGETIVGDGTTAQLAAMLTGIAEKKQPEARKDMGDLANPIDNWRWLFKDYEAKGYVTMFSEDTARFAAFNYRLKGFKNPPTDHYARPFWLEARKQGWKLCINSRASHKVSLEYLLSFFRAYQRKRKFTFVSHDAVSHDNPNTLGYADDDLKNFLKSMKRESFLNNTFLIVFGDHGPRYSHMRKTIQGKLEERFPFLSITVPKWFSAKYPELYGNLVHNSHILTTPFDVYATLRHILSYPEYPSGIITGQSLFTKIDGGNRTCANAGVEDHWCPCLNLEEVPTDEPVVKETADFIVNHINSLTSQSNELLKLCHRLVLGEIVSAFRDMPSEGLQKFSKTQRDEICDSCGLVLGRKSENTLVKDTLYQLQLTTSPNEGFYEASVRIEHGVPTLVGEISRLDSYKDQVYCIESYPMLRKYCYCR